MNKKILPTFILFLIALFVPATSWAVETGSGGHSFILGTDAGDDLTVATDALVIEGDSNKNVGIGETEPGAKLQVTSTAVPQIYFSYSDSNSLEIAIDSKGDTSFTTDGGNFTFARDSSGNYMTMIVDTNGDTSFTSGGADFTFNGTVNLRDGNTGPGKLVFYEDDSDGGNKTVFQLGAQTQDVTYTLPPDDGDNTEVLQTDGSGVLTWAAGGSGDVTAVYDCSTGDCDDITVEKGDGLRFDSDVEVSFGDSSEFSFAHDSSLGAFVLGDTENAFLTVVDRGTAGNFGIGTTVPDAALHVESTTAPQIVAAYDGSNTFRISVDANGDTSFMPSGGDLSFFYAAGGEAMRIVNTTGYVGIGTTTASNILSIAGNLEFVDAGRDIVIVDNSGASLDIVEGANNYLRLVTTNGSEGIELSKNVSVTGAADLYVTSGNLSIGDTAPGAKLQVVSTTVIPQVYFAYDTSNSLDISVDSKGDTSFTTDGGDFTFARDATGNYMTMIVDTNGDTSFTSGGADFTFNGTVNLRDGNTGPGKLVFYEDDSDGGNKTVFQLGAQTQDVTYTLPPDDGDNTEVLQTDGSGALTWVAAGTGDVTTVYDCTTGNCDQITVSSGEGLYFVDDTTLTFGSDDGVSISYDASGETLAFHNGDTSFLNISPVSGNVGIGDSSPASQLVVGSDAGISVADGAGDAYVQSVLEVDGELELDGTLDADGSADFSGNVNISAGTFTHAAATEFLVSAGNVQINDSINFSIGTGDDLIIAHDGTNTTATTKTGNFILDNTNTTGATILQLGTDDNATDVQVLNNSGTVLLEVDGSGNVGIGDTEPGGKLQVVSTSVIPQAYFAYDSSNSLHVSVGSNGDTSFTTDGGDFTFARDNSGNYVTITSDTNGDTNFANSGGDFTFAGNVTVADRLHFVSATAASAVCIDDDGSDRLFHDTDCDSTKDGGEEYIDQAGGGTGDVTAVFSCATGDCHDLTVESGDGLYFADDTLLTFGSDDGVSISYDASGETLAFHNGDTSFVNIDLNGNVGIGTTSPIVELEVAGDLAIGGVTNTNSFELTVKTDGNGRGIMVGPTGDFSSASNRRVFAGSQTNGGNILVYDTAGTANVSITGADNDDSYFNIGGGNLGIGTSTPDGFLHVEGSPQAQAVFAYDSAETFSISVDSNGDTSFATDGGDFTFSAGGNDMTKIKTTDMEFTGTAKPKRRVFIPAASGYCRTTAGCEALSTLETTNQKVMVKYHLFASDADDHWQVSWTIPENYDGEDFTASVEWSDDPGDSATGGGVAWFVQMMSVSDDDPLDTAWGDAVELNDDLTTSDDFLRTAESGAIAASSSPAGGDRLFIQVYRDVSDSDDDLSGGTNQKAAFLGIWITYSVDELSTED